MSKSKCVLCGEPTVLWMDGGFGKIGDCCMTDDAKALFVPPESEDE